MDFEYSNTLDAQLDELIGKTIERIVGMENNSHQVEIHTTDGDVYGLWHSQSCCESVYLEDVVGDVQDLIGEPVTIAETVEGEVPPVDEAWDEVRWTFYRFATRKGYVTLRWYGSSNGYYSTEVSFGKAEKKAA